MDSKPDSRPAEPFREGFVRIIENLYGISMKVNRLLGLGSYKTYTAYIGEGAEAEAFEG